MDNKLPGKKEEFFAALLKGVASELPFGGLFSELWEGLLSPVEKRRQLWAEEMETALNDLKKRHQRLPKELAEDPVFVSALLRATRIALTTHRKEKIDALRNFITTVGSKAMPDEELQFALMRLLEDLSVGHLEVLSFLESEYATISKKAELEAVFEVYNNHEGLLSRMAFRWILADLVSRMVIHLGDLEDMNEFSSQQQWIVTEKSKIRPLQITGLGRELLKILKQ